MKTNQKWIYIYFAKSIEFTLIVFCPIPGNILNSLYNIIIKRSTQEKIYRFLKSLGNKKSSGKLSAFLFDISFNQRKKKKDVYIQSWTPGNDLSATNWWQREKKMLYNVSTATDSFHIFDCIYRQYYILLYVWIYTGGQPLFWLPLII